MNFIKHIGVWKKINIIFFLSLSIALVYMYVNYNSWCLDKDIFCYYRFYDAIYNPIYFGGRIFAIILGLLLFIPSHIFKKWFLFVAIPIILMTVYFVQGISVFSDNFLNPTRAKMAENGMIFLGIVTIVFVATHLIYDLRKRRKSKL